MNRQAAAVARLTLSRSRLRLALVGDTGLGSAASLLGRLVQRHPLGAAALALLLGGLLARTRPWRWLLRPELWAAVLPQVLAGLGGAQGAGWAVVLAELLREAAVTAAQPPAAQNAAQNAAQSPAECTAKGAPGAVPA